MAAFVCRSAAVISDDPAFETTCDGLLIVPEQHHDRRLIIKTRHLGLFVESRDIALLRACWYFKWREKHV